MDYKLEALHKVYKKEVKKHITLVWCVFISFAVSLSMMIICAVLNRQTWEIAVFTILWALCALWLILEVMLSSAYPKCYISDNIRKAEKDYQLALAEEKWGEEIKAKAIEALQRERDGKIDYLVSHIEEIKRMVETFAPKPFTISPDIATLGGCVVPVPKMSTLDKKLEPKKPCLPIIPTKDHKITLQGFFAMNKACIHVKNENQAVKLCEAFDKMGKKWCNGEESYLLTTNYGNHKNETCYTNRGTYANKEWFVHDGGWVIYDFSEVCFEPKKKGGK